MHISTHKTQGTLSYSLEGTQVLYLIVWRAHIHIWNGQPYQLQASTHALTGQAFSTNKKSITRQIQPKRFLTPCLQFTCTNLCISPRPHCDAWLSETAGRYMWSWRWGCWTTSECWLALDHVRCFDWCHCCCRHHHRLCRTPAPPCLCGQRIKWHWMHSEAYNNNDRHFSTALLSGVHKLCFDQNDTECTLKHSIKIIDNFCTALFLNSLRFWSKMTLNAPWRI